MTALAEKVVECSYEPFTIGPTWKKTEDGGWLLPERTLGWQIIGWCAENLLGPDGEPWLFTPEQMRLVLWIYALDERGRYLYSDLVIQRMKGAGKDPLAAVLAVVEFLGPCRFLRWATEDDVRNGVDGYFPDAVGDPIGREERNAWVQIAAVSESQTKNTMGLIPGLISRECRAEYGVDLGKTVIYALDGTRRLEVISSGYRTAEGNRPTFFVRNETHHWLSSNGGDELAAVARRNLGKGAGGQFRGLSITNAYSPSENSFAKLQREAYLDAMTSGLASKTLYDSLEAPVGSTIIPPFTEWDPDEAHGIARYEEHPDGTVTMIDPSIEEVRGHLQRMLERVRGDAWWLDIERLIDDIFSGEMSTEEAKRFYLNSITLGDDASFSPDDIRATIDPTIGAKRHGWEGDPLRLGWLPVKPTDPVVMFGDGSKSDDATGLIGCRLSDGYLFTIGVWQRPPKQRVRAWTAPRDEVDGRVQEAFGRFNIVGFWFDPSHAKDDEDQSRYWDVLVDRWHQTYADRLQFWAQLSGDRRSSVGWDMTSPARGADFVQGVGRFTDELESHLFQHDGHPALVEHLTNCRRYMTPYGLSVSKINKSSARKIDLGVCAIGARHLRHVALNKGLEDEDPKAGNVWW